MKNKCTPKREETAIKGKMTLKPLLVQEAIIEEPVETNQLDLLIYRCIQIARQEIISTSPTLKTRKKYLPELNVETVNLSIAFALHPKLTAKIIEEEK